MSWVEQERKIWEDGDVAGRRHGQSSGLAVNGDWRLVSTQEGRRIACHLSFAPQASNAPTLLNSRWMFMDPWRSYPGIAYPAV